MRVRFAVVTLVLSPVGAKPMWGTMTRSATWSSDLRPRQGIPTVERL